MSFVFLRVCEVNFEVVVLLSGKIVIEAIFCHKKVRNTKTVSLQQKQQQQQQQQLLNSLTLNLKHVSLKKLYYFSPFQKKKLFEVLKKFREFTLNFQFCKLQV